MPVGKSGYSQIFEHASPSVVFVSTRQRVVDYWGRNVFSVPKGTGFGFAWDDPGHVVTNYHVIKGASEVTVWANDGCSYRAVLVGANLARYLAVLRINVSFDRLPPESVGTSGLVSALDRALSEDNGVTIDPY